MRYTTRNLPLSNGIKTISILKRLNGDLAFTVFTIQKLHGETDKQRHSPTKLCDGAQMANF